MHSSSSRVTIRTLAAAAGLLVAVSAAFAAPVRAQTTVSVREADHDSVAWIVPRARRDAAESAIRTRDERAMMLLMDSTVVLQLTDEGLENIFEADRASTTENTGGVILARLVRAGVTGFLDHGVAYKLSALRSAWADGNRLVLEDRDGHHVFETVEIDGRRPMEDFSAVQVRRFAAAVDHAIRARR